MGLISRLHSLIDVESNKHEAIEQTLLALSLSSVVSEKKAEYVSAYVKITYQCSDSANFAFSKVHDSEFKRVISNLINNAIESMPESNRSCEVVVKISADEGMIYVSISDNGVGIDPDVLKKINDNEFIESSKETSMGLGVKHAYEFIAHYQGEIAYRSNIGVGTEVKIMLRRARPPVWLCDEIILFRGGSVVVLDDDSAIHAAWEQKFKVVLSGVDQPLMHHFYDASTCLKYIGALSDAEKSQVTLLSDYELINDKLSGLDVIKLAKLKNAILVTSYYRNKFILKRAILSNIKIIPKLLAASVTVKSVSQEISLNNQRLACADLVLLDNDKLLTDSLEFIAERKKCTLHVYNDPYALWGSLSCYKQEAVFCLDYDLNLPVNGIEIAEELHKQGFSQLYLISGYNFEKAKLSAILSVVTNKQDIFNLVG
jgi:anti-sigma regulatory factor (Ser/Thr protein kinase)